MPWRTWTWPPTYNELDMATHIQNDLHMAICIQCDLDMATHIQYHLNMATHIKYDLDMATHIQYETLKNSETLDANMLQLDGGLDMNPKAFIKKTFIHELHQQLT